MLYSIAVKASFPIKKRNELAWLVAPNLARFPWLLHAFSTRLGGVSKSPAAGLNLGAAVGRQPAAVLTNRRLFFAALRRERFSLASAHQVHSAQILEAVCGPDGKLQYRPAGCHAQEAARSGIQRADAILTSDRGVLLSVRTADCLPILVVDPTSRVVAAIHAGWRGALKRVAEKAVGEMQRAFGSRPRQLFAAIGPSIGPCCYEVGDDVVDAFLGQFANAPRYFLKFGASSASLPGASFLPPPGRARPAGSGQALDLTAAVRDQLRCAGVPDSHINAAGLCTSCHSDLFFSYRRDGVATGRMMAMIGMR